METIPVEQKFITMSELMDKGYSYYRIGVMEKNGFIRRINRSTYENLNYTGDENDFFSAEAYVPKGVVCLMSAARYYELTNFLPDAVDVAVERTKKISTLPEWPRIKLFYFAAVRMELGIKEIHDGANKFHIFDMEKTVVDIVYYRNKVGIEETAEVLRNYMHNKDRCIDKLYEYSRLMRCEKVLRTYMEVLL